jgi:hypothetical protein
LESLSQEYKIMKKIAFVAIPLLVVFLSCSETTPVGGDPSSDGQFGLSSNELPYSNPTEYSSQDPYSSQNPVTSYDPTSSDWQVSSSSFTQNPSSSTSSAITPSSAAPVDNGTYEKLTTSNAQQGWGSRYWDACKPHCSQRENVSINANPFSVCRNCDANGKEIPAFTLSPNVNEWWTGYEGTKSACEGGPAYACMDMAPIAVNDTLAYAYGATSKSNAQCGQCFQIQFDGGGHYGGKQAHRLIEGKTLIIMASNTGTDVEAGQFDIMIPGGGVGMYDALSSQVGVSKAAMGEQYGGFLTTCQKELNNYDLPADKYKACVRSKCDAVFGTDAKFADLLRGCHWFVDWMHAADNPTYLVKPVACPDYLAQKYPSTINNTKDTDIPAGGF